MKTKGTKKATHVINWGVNLEPVAEEMVKLAKESQKLVRVEFNGIMLEAKAETTATVIISAYETERTKNAIEARAAEKIQEEAERKESQSKHDELMKQLSNLDYSDQGSLIDFLCEMEKYFMYGEKVKENNLVIETFANNGYHPHVNNGKDFQKDDSDNVARWIIGTGLHHLRNGGSIHQGIHGLKDRWKKEFSKKTKRKRNKNPLVTN